MKDNSSHQMLHQIIQAQTTTNNSSQQSQAQTTSHFQEIGTNQNHHDHHQQGKIATQGSTDSMDVTNMIDYSTIDLFTKTSSNLIDPTGCIKSGKGIIAGVIKFLVELNALCFGDSLLFDTLSKPQTQTLLLNFNQDVIFTERSSSDDSQSSGSFSLNKAGVYSPFCYCFQRKVLNYGSLEILVSMKFMLGYYYLVFIIPFTCYWESFPVVTLGLLFFICSLCS